MTDDLATLDALFAPGPETLRGDANGLLVGKDAIRAFRGGRGGAPPRQIIDVHVRAAGADHALVIAVTAPETGGRGQQTQLWRRDPAGWVITAAHVAAPAAAFDPRIWRVLGDPLVGGAGAGPLAGESVAVKDLYAVAGQSVGAGNPAWLAQAPVESNHAAAVERLLAAGADVRGVARTDEFAYSLAGTNAHYGTPPNPAAPYRLPGGSTSGSATAVALGHATVGLGTDTAGSIRVPAAYQGLFSIRATHGAVGSRGLLPLAPSFDAVGWLTRDAVTLARVGGALLPTPRPPERSVLVAVPELLGMADSDVAAAVTAWLPSTKKVERWDLSPLPTWVEAFRTWQAWEAWQAHGPWLGSRLEELGDDVRERFEHARSISPLAADRAQEIVAEARSTIRSLVADRFVALPTTPGVAPLAGAPEHNIRAATVALTCLASIAGLPAISLPLTTAAGLPCGVSVLAAPGRDHDLLRLAQLHPEL